MDTNQIIAATQDLELDDLADILNDLPDQILENKQVKKVYLGESFRM